jgi:hypothetical protein
MNKLLFESVIMLYLPVVLIGYKNFVFDNLKNLKKINLLCLFFYI